MSFSIAKPTVRLAVPMAAVMLSGCFATQQDIRVLQGDLALIRSEAAAQDSARPPRNGEEPG